MSFRILAGIMLFCLVPLSWATPGVVTRMSGVLSKLTYKAIEP